MKHGNEEKGNDEKNIRYDFTSVLLPYDDIEGLKRHLTDHIDNIGQYPETEPVTLEHEMAQMLHLPEGTVLMTNGASEAIFLIAQHFRGATSVIPQPTSTLYAQACASHGHNVTYDDKEVFDDLPTNRLYWLCNPNSPTGNVLPKTFVKYLVHQNSQYTFIIDQSYEALTDEEVPTPREMFTFPNVLTIHSASRKYGIPGIRLGYITGSPAVIDQLRMQRQPWALSPLTILAAQYLIKHPKQNNGDIGERLAEAKRLREQLNAIEGISVMESNTLFMLVHVDSFTAKETCHLLLERYGLKVRDASNHHSLDDHYIRITSQTTEVNNLLINALQELVHTS